MSSKNRLGLYILLFFASFYCVFSIGHFGGDGYEDYLTAESIVLDGNLALFDRPGDVDELQYKTDVGIKGADGRVYSARGSLGVPVLLAPFYALGHFASSAFPQVPHDFVTMVCVSFYNPLVSALGVFLLFLVASRMGFDRSVSLAVTFMYGLSTMVPVYARTGFAEPTLVLFLLLSVYFLLRYQARLTPVDLIASAVMASLCVFVKAAGLIFIPCIFLYASWVVLERKESPGRKIFFIAVFSAIIIFGAAVMMLLNHSIYGKYLSSGGYNMAGGAKRILQSAHFLKGIYYYLFSTGKGFFLYNLPVFLALLAVGRVMKERRKEGMLFLLIFIVNVVFYAKSFRRGSLFSWGPRYLLPSVPFMVLLAGYCVDRCKGVISKVFISLIAFTGFLIMLPCMFVNQSKFYFFVVEKLGLNEYMINFVPDLSPIKGAWSMFISRITQGAGGGASSFVYAPDWRLVKPIKVFMNGYDHVDIWFMKVAKTAPDFSGLVYGVMACIALVSVLSIYKTLRTK